MDENYKHLYEQTKKMLTMYQDELVPGYRKKIEELEKNQVNVRCKECTYWKHMEDSMGDCTNGRFHIPGVADITMMAEEYCCLGERKDNERKAD